MKTLLHESASIQLQVKDLPTHIKIFKLKNIHNKHENLTTLNLVLSTTSLSLTTDVSEENRKIIVGDAYLVWGLKVIVLFRSNHPRECWLRRKQLNSYEREMRGLQLGREGRGYSLPSTVSKAKRGPCKDTLIPKLMTGGV